MSKMGQRERQAAEGEVKVLSKLKHPYIVRYFESFVHGKKLCIVMDYCDGGDLHKYIERRRRQRSMIPEPQVFRWFTQMCLALKYMHDEKHVMHRDVKPQNVFLMPKEGGQLGSVKLADFGISKVLPVGALAKTQCGTPYYLSPEQCRHQSYGYGCDVWALGCVLYQLCAQKVPFEAQSLQDLMDKISSGSVPPAPAGFSREIGALIPAILDRNSTRRPNCAGILQRARVQQEIQAMYAENHKGRGEDDAAPPRAQSNTPRRPGTPPPRGDRVRPPSPAVRARSPSPALKKVGARDASPHRGIAKEVLCPARDASPRPRLPHRGGA